MRSHRFYTSENLSSKQTYILPKEASHHCVQVLRYKVGAKLTLFNGDGYNYSATIKTINGKQCTVKIESKKQPNNESPLAIHLFQAIARGEKMDLIIQKAVELGVHQITPIFSERSHVKLDKKRLLKKLQHWQNVSISASEQSGRALVININSPLNLNQLAIDNKEYCLFLQPTANQNIQDILLEKIIANKINLFIGPEGGFSDIDLQHLEQFNGQKIKLGPRILRTETAGLTCIAILQSQFGDL